MRFGVCSEAGWQLCGGSCSASAWQHTSAPVALCPVSCWRSPNLHASRHIIKYVCAFRALKSFKGRIWLTDDVLSLAAACSSELDTCVCEFHHMLALLRHWDHAVSLDATALVCAMLWDRLGSTAAGFGCRWFGQNPTWNLLSAVSHTTPSEGRHAKHC